MGAGAVVVSAAAHLAAREANASELLPAGELAKVTLAVNGRRHVVLVEAQVVAITTLEWPNRDREGVCLTLPIP